MSSTGSPAAPGPSRPAVHVPVLLERVTELLAPACARRRRRPRRRHPGPRRALAGHARRPPRSAADRPGPRPRGPCRGRPPHRGRRAQRPRHARPRRLRRTARRARPAGHRRGAGRAVRPRRLLAAARPARARLQLLRRRAAGHAHGPRRAADRRRRRQHLLAEGPGARAAGLRRGAVRLADRRGHRARARPASRSRRPPGWPSWCATRSPPRPGAPAGTRPSGRSRRCASRSTTSWEPWSAPCRPRSTRWPSAGGSS